MFDVAVLAREASPLPPGWCARGGERCPPAARPPASLECPRPLGSGGRPRCAGEGCGRLAEAQGRHARILITTSTGACQGPAAPANHRVRGAGGRGGREAPSAAPGPGRLRSQWELPGRRGGGARAARGPSRPSPPAPPTSACGARASGGPCGPRRPPLVSRALREAGPSRAGTGTRGARRLLAATKGPMGARRRRRVRSGSRAELGGPGTNAGLSGGVHSPAPCARRPPA